MTVRRSRTRAAQKRAAKLRAPTEPDGRAPFGSGNDEAQFEHKLGEVVRQLRESLGLSQDSLAQKVGASQANISKIETNRAKNYASGLLQRLADALGIQLYELFALAQGVHLEDQQALTQTEAKLLAAFRELSADQQKTVIAVVETLRPPRSLQR